ncbi:MAG: DUF3488 and transglutaminase-like domain-containing protein [Candidatus Hydrogenedentes bacterium]|nr:DUF3488 and transglutaminase-like domain-containing protein [Candidatus Hydrogenedentota bacterium]
MNARRMATLALIAVQCAAMASLTKSYSYPLAMLALAVLAPLTPKRLIPDGRATAFLSVVVGAILLTYAQRAEQQGGFTMWFPTYAMAVAFGRFFLFLQIMIVIRNSRQTPSPVIVALLPFLAILVMTCIGNVSSLSVPVDMFRLLSLFFAVLIAAYFASSLRDSAQGKTRAHVLRWALNIGFMGVALSVAISVSAAVQHYGNELDRLLGIAAGSSMPSTTAFTARARLDSMTRLRGSGGTKIALRIVSDDPPGYMRGIAYDTYAPPEWRVTGEVDALSPATSPPARLKDFTSSEPWYSIRDDGSTTWKPQVVWRVGRQEGALFAPLDTAWMATRSTGVAMDPQSIVRAETILAEFTNALSGKPDTRPLSVEMRESLTKLPDDIDPRITALALQLTRDANSDGEKIAAVLHYFHDYRYSTDIRIPAADDPLVYFLMEKPPAHCEFFAAGTTVLLRAAGVPARYVVGFLVTERNALGGYWYARNRDAHAWCEAFDSEHGWTTVDATPPSGRPSVEAASPMASLWDGLKFYGGRVLAATTDALQKAIDRFPQYMQAAAARLASPRWIISLLAVALVLASAILHRRNRRRRMARARDAFAEFHCLLGMMDRRVAKAGLRREAHETLEQFCARILNSPTPDTAAIVAWYRAYMRARYGPDLAVDGVETLRRTLPAESPAPQ